MGTKTVPNFTRKFVALGLLTSGIAASVSEQAGAANFVLGTGDVLQCVGPGFNTGKPVEFVQVKKTGSFDKNLELIFFSHCESGIMVVTLFPTIAQWKTAQETKLIIKGFILHETRIMGGRKIVPKQSRLFLCSGWHWGRGFALGPNAAHAPLGKLALAAVSLQSEANRTGAYMAAGHHSSLETLPDSW